jgi:hypothetical protein
MELGVSGPASEDEKESARGEGRKRHTWDEGQKGQEETSMRNAVFIAAGWGATCNVGETRQGAKSEARFETVSMCAACSPRTQTLGAHQCGCLALLGYWGATTPAALFRRLSRGERRVFQRRAWAWWRTQARPCGLTWVVEAESLRDAGVLRRALTQVV